MKKNVTPPKFAGWILNRLLLRNEGSEKLGDLEEGFWIKLDEEGITRAKLWYWLQLILTVPVVIKNSITWGSIMFKNYLKISIRNIKKFKTYSTINILGLAAGMACFILILLWVQNELSYEDFHVNGEDLYRVTLEIDGHVGQNSPWALLSYLKKDFPEIEKGSWFFDGPINVKYEHHNFNETIALVTPEFLEMFTFPFILGDPATAISDLNSVVISERIALKYFGGENPIGKILHLNDQSDLTVTGVIKNVPKNSHMEFDLISRPDVFVPNERFQMWRVDCPIYIQLAAGTDYQKTIKKIEGTIIKYNNDLTGWMVGLQPLKEIHLYSLKGTHPITYIYISAGIALMVLLIACVNFMNLSTARSALRAKEIGMRKVIGAKRKDVIIQFFSESILLSFFSLMVAILLVYLFLPFLNDIIDTQLTLNLIENAQITVGLILVAAITGIISGTYPSLYLSSFQPAQVMKSSITKSNKGKVLRRWLIIFQFTIATLLIICTSIILKQMNFIKTKDLGFNRNNIMIIRMNNELLEKYEIIKQRLNNNRNILSVTSASSVPARIGGTQGVYWEGINPEDSKMFSFIRADYDYFKTFDMKIVKGRSFSKNYSTDRESYIINETALRMMGFEDPIGKNIWAGLPGNIIGVVKDFHGTSLHNQILPAVFMMEYPVPKRNLFIKVNSADLSSSIEFIEEIITEISPEFIFNFNFLDEYFNRMYNREFRLQKLLEYFTVLAIFISCLGLIGLASFITEQRTKEIAVRKVLGAKTVGLMGNLSREFVLLVIAANLIAYPLAYYFMGGWIDSFAYRTNIGATVFALSTSIILFIAFFTIIFQIFIAANRNPAESLKQD